MDRWSFNIDACFNVFMTVAYDADGTWEIRPPKGKPGDYMTMRALMPQIVAISNCPVLFNACNNFRLKPLTLEILQGAGLARHLDLPTGRASLPVGSVTIVKVPMPSSPRSPLS